MTANFIIAKYPCFGTKHYDTFVSGCEAAWATFQNSVTANIGAYIALVAEDTGEILADNTGYVAQ